MRIRPFLLLLSFMFAGFASLSGSEIKIKVPVAQAIVYSDRADVTRTVEVDLPKGISSIVFEDLKGHLEESSLRVSGSGDFELLDIRIEKEQTAKTSDEALRALEVEREGYESRLRELAFDEKRNAESRETLDRILSRLTTTQKEDAGVEMDMTKWASVYNFHSEGLAKLDAQSLAIDEEERHLKDEINRVNREMNQLRHSGGKQIISARVSVRADKAGKATLSLSSIIYGPSWSPAYDVRVVSDSRKLALTYYATLQQSTGEDWEHVKLSFSTATPMIGGKQPELKPWVVSERSVDSFRGNSPRKAEQHAPMMNQMMLAEEHSPFGIARASAPVPAAAPMRVARASAQTGVTSAVFNVEAPADVLGDNSQAKVTLMHETFDAYLRHSCVPKLSSHAYLKAKVTNATDFPLLAGESAVFLDNNFVANAQFDFVAPGESFWTWLGIDQAVKIERKMIKNTKGTEGVFSKHNLHEFEYLTTITNNRRDKVNLVMWDQIPMSSDERIKVELHQPRYSKDSDTLKMNEQKFIEWLFELEPAQEVKVPFEYLVEYPKDMILQGL